jgi:PAS domain S-box-containing protein
MADPNQEEGEQRETDELTGMAGWSGQQELALLRSAIRAIGEAIIITGPDLDPPGPLIEYVNPGFEHMTGYAASEVIGKSPRLLQGPNTDRAELDRLRGALSAGCPFRGNAINYRKDGTEYAVEWVITPVLDAGRVAHWIAAQRDVTERRRAEERQQRMVDELNHRVNNSLTAVQSVAAQTLQDGQRSVGEMREAFRNRLLALSRVHVLLAREHWEGVPLKSLAAGQLSPRRDLASGRIDIAGPDVRIGPGAAVALGMAFHELATNALRHGALSSQSGHVRLQWSIEPGPEGGHLRLQWTEEDGPPVPSPPPRRGFGSRLLERGLAHGIQAGVRLLFETSGLRCEVDAPLKAVAGTKR